MEPRLFEAVLPDLHRLAQYLMRKERPDHSFQATVLLNEAYLKLAGGRLVDWENRKHFFAVAARSMRHLLIDHARAKARGVGAKDLKVPIEGLEHLLAGKDAQLETGLAIDMLLNEMEKDHPEWCAIVDLKFYVGFTDEETAEALGLPLRTMQRQFGAARRWLFERLETSPSS